MRKECLQVLLWDLVNLPGLTVPSGKAYEYNNMDHDQEVNCLSLSWAS